MAYTLIIKEEALADAIDAFNYYESKVAGLGEKFLDALLYRYTQISLNPQHYSYISADKEKTLRDVKLKAFPYVVIYEFYDNEVIVYAVHNCHKHRIS